MNDRERRLAKVEQRISPNPEPEFIEWLGRPWTDREKSEAMKKHPDRRIHWKSLSDTIPPEGHDP